MLLNTVLTVRAGQANSHKEQGWEQFTDAVIDLLAAREEPLILYCGVNQRNAKAINSKI